MRIAIVSDIHGNLTAFEAVLADLRKTAPDIVLHGGDLADAGANPVEIVDRIRQLGWPGVVGNTDEMLFAPASLSEYARHSPAMAPLLPRLHQMASATRESLGEERLRWLNDLPRVQRVEAMTLLHASPETAWRAPLPNAPQAEMESVYGTLGAAIVVYGHIHQPFVRKIDGWTLVNSGSVSLSYDGDPRAAYALIEDGIATVRRVEYDLEREVEALSQRSFPHWQWLAKILRAARPQLP